ncbi:hypothetical protein [Phaeocystidibacter luteus]|uniref:ATP-binding cassette domain-containing protein n=1 Tax=Phaeocystidibacter luteus TaxID=911197 RepID=A0A6N6RLV9_9FLAO|nr:hypothetical protein [Phaeocystidibacter luteus]KAB2814569.1 hypothetical protein F8C67_02180 [Phaeocystidibacter luteus]
MADNLKDFAKGSLFSVLLGTNGTGKSTVLRKILDAHQGRALVIPANQHEKTFSDLPLITLDQVATFEGKAKYMCYKREDFDELVPHLSNMLLISDDFRNWLSGYSPTDRVRKFFIDRRHINVDIYFAAHGFSQVPVEIFTWIDVFFLFRTRDSIKRGKDRLMNPEALIKIQEEVNREARNNPFHYEIIKNQ